MNRLHLRYRLINSKGHFVDMMDPRKTTRDPNRALMLSMEQVDNCLKRYPELEGFKVQEVVKSNNQVLR